MASTNVTLTIRANTRLFRAWLEVCRILAFLGLPEARAIDLAYAGRSLVLIKIDNGRWRRLRP